MNPLQTWTCEKADEYVALQPPIQTPGKEGHIINGHLYTAQKRWSLEAMLHRGLSESIATQTQYLSLYVHDKNCCGNHKTGPDTTERITWKVVKNYKEVGYYKCPKRTNDEVKKLLESIYGQANAEMKQTPFEKRFSHPSGNKRVAQDLEKKGVKPDSNEAMRIMSKQGLAPSGERKIE